jgi:hypothetical protein
MEIDARRGGRLVFALMLAGCATIFGWDIHAPGVLSNNFFQKVSPVRERIALWMDPALMAVVSKNRGGKTADPQTYHIGEAFAPMLIEAFQSGFEEFVLMEAAPSPEIMKQYGIRWLVNVRIREFENDVTWKGQTLRLKIESVVLDPDLKEAARFESAGSSEAEKVFSKKGGPEVHLNVTLENTAEALILHLQDLMRTGKLA